MPSAQGHITVRRRAKNGTDGSDAVRYWVIPSATQVKRAQDGTMYPTTVTCEKRKQKGNAAPVVTNEGTLYYQIGYEDGSISGRSVYGSSGVKTTKAMTWIKFMLDVSQVEVASETVTVVVDGEDAYTLDLDNEMQGIPCNSSGTPTGTGILASTKATVYRGSKIDTGWTFSKTDTNCTSTIDSNGKVSVTAISADNASVTVKATKGNLTREAVMSLYKVKAGPDGLTPVVYSIEVSANAISRSNNGVLNPSSISAYKIKTVGNSTARTYDMILKYYREGQEAASQAHIINGQGGVINGLSASCTAVVITLYSTDGSTVIDRERIPVVKDGADGQPGADAFVLDLDNEVEGIPCKSDGTPTGSGALATANATVYRGANIDTGWTFSREDTNCTSSINSSTGALIVTAISADKASVKVIASKGTQTLTAVMSLYKVKAGTDGSSPVVYSIEASVSVIRRDVSGNLSPHSSLRTSDMVLKYKREGQDSSETIIYGQGGEINGINSLCTAVIVTLYSSAGTVLDKKRIPVLKEGATACLINLDKSVIGILCTSAGQPIGTGTLAEINATVYKGASIDSGWTFSKTDTNCTSTIDANGKVSVTDISADNASVNVIATKGTQTLSSVLSLYKVKASSNSSSPVAYSTEVSARAISRNSNGVLNTSSISAYKIKTVGNSMIAYQNRTVGGVTSRVSNRTLTYQRIGQDSSPITLPGEGGIIENISAACTGIKLELKNGTTLLDSETVPIVKDGNDAVTISVSPENVEFNYGKTENNREVAVSVYKGSRKLTYGSGAGHFLCSVLSDNSKLADGLYWNFDDSNPEKFRYFLTHGAGHELNMEIPFTVTVEGTAYERKICVRTVKDGAQGMPGAIRAPLRVREWDKLSAGTTFTSGDNDGDEWTDIVYRITSAVAAGVKYWRVKKYFSKTSGQEPPASEDEYLVATSSFGNLATDIFLAHYALIKNLGVETIEMRDSSGNILFLAKDGTVTCNTGNFKNVNIQNVTCDTGNFKNVNVSGAINVETLDLKISTQDHNGSYSPIPNGSICLDASRICLPELPAGSVRTIKVLNPSTTRTVGSDLLLSRATENVRISSDLSEMNAKSASLTIAQKGRNGNVYIELLGYHREGTQYTYWLTKMENIITT